MGILGISSATKTISVGMADNGKVLSELTVSGKQAFTEELMNHIDRTVNESGKSVRAVAVTIGPGSYSGLRGGLATAKTLCHALDVPLIEVSTLEAIAFNLSDITGTITAATDARKDEFNIAIFTSGGKRMTRLTRDMVMRLDAIASFLSKIEGEFHLCGNTCDIDAALRVLNEKSPVIRSGPNNSIPRGGNVALIGEEKLKKGETADPLSSVPKYSVDPKIREFQRR